MNERYELFKKLNEESLELYKAKNADYGDSFSKSYQEFGLTASVVRISDKVERLKALSKAEARVKDESIRDTLVDLANYAMMTVIELDIENEKVKDAEKAFEHVINVRMGNAEKSSQEMSRMIRQAFDRINRTGIQDKNPTHVGDKGPMGEPITLRQAMKFVDQLIEVEHDGSPEISISPMTDYERWLVGAKPKNKSKSEKEYTEGRKLNI